MLTAAVSKSQCLPYDTQRFCTSWSFVLVSYVLFYVRSHIKKWNPLGHFCTPLGALLCDFRNQIGAWAKQRRMRHTDCEDWECEAEWQIQNPRCSEEKWVSRPGQKGSEYLWLFTSEGNWGPRHLVSIHSLTVWLMVKTDRSGFVASVTKYKPQPQENSINKSNIL